MGTILILIILLTFIILKKLKIHINWKTFLKKGFKKEVDEYGVYCYCGKQGTGKTYSAISFIQNKREKTQKVITNVYSYYERNKNYCIYEPDIIKIIEMCEKEKFRNKYIIFYDEIFTYLEKGGKMNKKVLGFLSQMRKRGLYFITTAQEWLEIHMTFRRYTRYQIDCSMKNIPFVKLAICINKINDATQMKWDQMENEYIAPIVQTNIKKGNKEIIEMYDTYETIAI